MLTGILQPDYLNTTNGKTVYTNGVLNNGIGIYATHSGIAPRGIYNTNQCATCHVPSYTTASGNVSGHTFDMDPNGCALGGCHTSGYPDYVGYQVSTTNTLAAVVDLLNRWATNNAPALFTNYSKYLQNSWEYTAPGVLASLTNTGPSTADQLLLPTVIQQARFNVYMARNDGSLGVHNPAFTTLLLKDAETKVLSQFTTAKFTANSTTIGPNGKVVFTQLNPNVTNSVWNFGDGNTIVTTGSTVTNTYVSAGTYTVSLTATDNNGNTETLTRNNYINVYALPTANYTAVKGGLTTNNTDTVTFTSTGANTEYAKWSIYDNSGTISTAHRLAAMAGLSTTFTYTNTGNFPLVLQVSSPGGSVTITNTIAIP
jgi:PKD repeat protein